MTFSLSNDVVAEAWDQLDVMLRQEVEYSESCKLQHQEVLFRSTEAAKCSVTWKEAVMVRQKMCTWVFDVVDYFHFPRDVVHTVLNLVDRYVTEILRSEERSLDRKGYQSLFVVALYVALKLQGQGTSENRSSSTASGTGQSSASSSSSSLIGAVPIEVFIKMSRGLYTVESLEEEEQSLISKLQLRLNPPTSGNFNEYLIFLLVKENSLHSNLRMCNIAGKIQNYIFEVSKYHTELSAFDVTLTTDCHPSCVAAASILNAMDYLRLRLGDESVSVERIEAFQYDVLSVLPEVTIGKINEARSCLRALCPPQMLDSWPGGWNKDSMESTHSTENSAEKLGEDQAKDSALVAPDSPTGVSTDIFSY